MTVASPHALLSAIPSSAYSLGRPFLFDAGLCCEAGHSTNHYNPLCCSGRLALVLRRCLASSGTSEAGYGMDLERGFPDVLQAHGMIGAQAAAGSIYTPCSVLMEWGSSPFKQNLSFEHRRRGASDINLSILGWPKSHAASYTPGLLKASNSTHHDTHSHRTITHMHICYRACFVDITKTRLPPVTYPTCPYTH